MNKITAIVILTIIIATIGLSVDSLRGQNYYNRTWAIDTPRVKKIWLNPTELQPDTVFIGKLECCPGYAVVTTKTLIRTSLDTIRLRPWRIRNDSIFEFNYEMTDSIFINIIQR